MPRTLRASSLASLSSLAAVAALAALGPAVAAGCASTEREDVASQEDDFSSREAVQLDFELDGRLVTDSSFNAKAKIQDQFLYTIGHLNGERSVGRLDKLVLSNVQTVAQPDGTYEVTYHAKMPVAWGRKASVPTTYAFTLPKVVSYSALEAFTNRYKDKCVDWAAHDVDPGSMWYYYRPKTSGCPLDANDVVTFTATVTPSVDNTTGKFPEYHEVWKDDALRVVAIFGKNEDGATANDAGISAFNAFVRSMRTTLGGLSLVTEPADAPTDPGIAVPDITFSGTLPDGKKVSVTALLVDNISTTGPAFDARYNALSTTADVIMYNGHAGLGQNVRALANKGSFVAGKYLLLFMNGCDTFAYVDGSLAQKRAVLNPDDNADGTKYLDIVTNAMPSYFHQNSNASTALVKGLLGFAQPKTFEQMFQSIDTQQVVLVTGEEDNVFTPGMPIGGGGGGNDGGVDAWPGLDANGTVRRSEEQRFDTGEIPAGTYTFTLAGDADADLYVKKGTAPTVSSWDCRPYRNGSAETCTVTLAAPGTVHVMVRGWAASSTFTLTGR